MTARMPLRWLVWLGTALLALTLFGLLLDVPATEGDGHAFRVTILLGLLVLAAAVYFATVRLILRYAWPRGTVWIVVGVAIALRLLLLTAPPILSSDIYRYVWDGRVQAAGTNPYRYVPTDPALAFLRDPVVYPQINRAGYARTIYSPLTEVVFAMTGRISDNVTGIRLVMLGFEAVGIICLLRLLPLAGLPRERILIYAWNPLALWSFANDSHVDAIAVGLFGLALLLRARHKDAGPVRLSPERSSLSSSLWWSRPPSSAGGTSGAPPLPGSWSLAAVTHSTTAPACTCLAFCRPTGRRKVSSAEPDSGRWPVWRR